MHVVVDGIIFELQSRGGISRIYQEILPRMCEIDKSLHLTLLTSRGLERELPLHSRIAISSMPQFVNQFSSRMFNHRSANMVRRLMYGFSARAVSGDIWHSTYYTEPSGWFGYKVVTVIDMLHERFSDFFNETRHDAFRKIKRHSIENADAIICISETTKQDLANFIDLHHESINVIPLAYSKVFRVLSPKIIRNSDKENHSFLLFIGNRSGYKNFSLLVNAYRRWSFKREIPLVVVGRQWSSAEALLIHDSGISSNVLLLQNVDDEKLCELYNDALALVYPSQYEGFGIPLLEAMACACPIVASRIPSTIEVAGRIPIYFDPFSPDDLRCALDSVVAEGRNSNRVKDGLRYVDTYSWQRTATNTLEVYKQLSKGS